jgi:hypothetical protein
LPKEWAEAEEAAADAAAPAAAAGDRSLYTPEGDTHIDSKGGAVVTARFVWAAPHERAKHRSAESDHAAVRGVDCVR